VTTSPVPAAPVRPSAWVEVPPFRVGMEMTAAGARGAADALRAAADALDADPGRASLHVTFTVDRAAVDDPGDVPGDLEAAAAGHAQRARDLRQRAATVREALARGGA